MAIVWTKYWQGSDDGTVLKAIDLRNIQDDLAVVSTSSDIGITVQAWDADLDTLSTPELVNSANLVINGAFDTFPTPPTPSNWTVEGGGTEAQNSTEVQVGSYSYKITSDADGSASRQTVYGTINATTNSYWRGREVTLTARVYTESASNARLQADDGVGTSESSYHTGTTGWETVTVTHTLDVAATKLDVVLLVDGNTLNASFDAVRMNNGAASWEFIRHPGETTSGVSNTFTSVHLTEASAPTTLASEGAIYTKDVGGQPELFYRSESDGTEVQLTNGGSASGGVPTNIQAFTTTGTWTQPAGITTVHVKVWGGGGNGGTGSVGGSVGGGGGGGGGYAEGLIAVTGDVTITIGATCSFAGTTTIQATKGGNSAGAVAGTGGVGSVGTLNLTGGAGGTAGISGSSSTCDGAGGGGCPLGGAGGAGGTAGGAAVGAAGTFPGGGGGGGTDIGSSAGGAGAGGYVVVTY